MYTDVATLANHRATAGETKLAGMSKIAINPRERSERELTLTWVETTLRNQLVTRRARQFGIGGIPNIR